MERPPFAIVMGAGDIEDHAVGVKVGIVGAGRPMLKHRGHDVGGKNLDLAVLVTNSGVAAEFPDGVFERGADRVVVGPFDLAAKLVGRHCPEGGDGLVGVEGKIVGRTAVRTSGVACELLAGDRMISVVEFVEVRRVEGASVLGLTVLAPEESRGIPPDAIRFLA